MASFHPEAFFKHMDVLLEGGNLDQIYTLVKTESWKWKTPSTSQCRTYLPDIPSQHKTDEVSSSSSPYLQCNLFSDYLQDPYQERPADLTECSNESFETTEVEMSTAIHESHYALPDTNSAEFKTISNSPETKQGLIDVINNLNEENNKQRDSICKEIQTKPDLVNNIYNLTKTPKDISPVTSPQKTLEQSSKSKAMDTSKRKPNPADSKPYKCDFCGKSFKVASSKTRHERIHTGEKLFHCGHCAKPFTSEAKKLRHEGIHTRKKPDKNSHQGIHNGENDLKCDYCEKVLSTQYSKRRHERTHKDGELLKCDYCPKAFVNNGSKIQHEQTHTGNKKAFKCSFCQKLFENNSAKARHERIHTGEKPYKCGHCPKTFSRQHHKRDHERTHTREKPYKCGYCSETFQYRKAKKRHEEQEHHQQV